MADARELKIKTGVVSRLGKELLSYAKELEENIKHMEAVRESSDHSKLKQWENVCAETRGMIPDTQSRLETAIEELQALISDPSVTASAGGEAARTEIEKAENILRQATTLENGQ